MRISERVDNAVRAMVELASGELATRPGGVVKADAIAQRQNISLKYLLDITRDLKRAELVRSKRGPDGGFSHSLGLLPTSRWPTCSVRSMAHWRTFMTRACGT